MSIEYPKKIKYESIQNLVYSGSTDVLYIYITDDFTSEYVYKTLKMLLTKNVEPCLKDIDLDKINNTNVIELMYMQDTIIKTNSKDKIKTIKI